MSIRIYGDRRQAWLASALALTCACTGSDVGTETDNPDMKPPTYQSPSSFGQDQTGGQIPAPRACPGPESVGMPRQLPLWGQDGTSLIGATVYRGLIVVDASDATKPQLASQTPLAGEPHQIIVQSGAQVTLAIDQIPTGAQDKVLTPTELQPVTHLVRFDASDPHAVKRVADVALEGEFWSMRMRGSTLWVMSAAVDDPIGSCNRPRFDCGYANRTALIVAGYQFVSGAWQRVARTELKTTGPAWELPDGYAGFELRANAAGDVATATGVLRFVRFDGAGALGDPGMVAVPGQVVPGAPIGLSDSVVHVFTRDYVHGTSQLDTIALDSGALLSTLDDLPQQQFDDSVFIGDRLIMDAELNGDTAQLIDFSDPVAPTTQPLPQGVTRVIVLGDGTRVLGLNKVDNLQAALTAELQASLISLQDAAPKLLDHVAINQGGSALGVDAVQVLGTRVVVGYRTLDNAPVTVALEASATSLSRIGVLDTGYADQILADADTFYAAEGTGLRAGSFAGGDAHVLHWAREVIDAVTAGAYRATLTRNDAGAGVLELSKEGQLVSSFDAGPSPNRLIADDAHLLVLSLEPRDQCQQTGLDCSQYAPNVAIFTLGDTPALAATVAISDPDAQGQINGQNRVNWDTEGNVAFALGKGNFVLVADYEAQCSSEQQCADSGVKPDRANQGLNAGTAATPPCGPGASCPAIPAPVQTATSAFGEKHATRLYLLDASAAAPRFAAPVDSVLELGDSRFAPVRISEGTLMVTRIERARVSGVGGADADNRPASIMLDRFVLATDKLQAQTAVNVPGFPIALEGNRSILFSVEPDSKTQGAAKLHMLALSDDAARPLDTIDLQASYSDAWAAFGKIFYLRHDGVDCDGTSFIAGFDMPGDKTGKLGAAHELAIPGGNYHIADARDGRLLLVDDRSHYVVLDVSGATPKLVKFLSADAGPSNPTLDGDSLFGGSGLFPDELTFN